jgi:hypothetical protein
MRALVLVFVAACSPNFADDVLLTDASIIRPDATTTDSGFDYDATTSDAGADVTLFNGGGPFMCRGCICDGTLDMCWLLSGGKGGPKSPITDASTSDAADASACVLDAGTSCVAIPIECLPKPTCACILDASGAGSCSCYADPSGNGLVIDCALPP